MKKQTLLFVLLLSATAWAKVDLVTLPQRDTVQLTIYNSADLTLARESRRLMFNQGRNELQFSWENTLIDPTSLDMTPLAQADRIDISALVYPPRVQNLGLWQVDSEINGKVPVEISYLTSGLSWRTFYMGTLSPDEQTMHLQGYVRVTNNSGEDYENAQVRLIVGEVHLLDQIADLARQEDPYGRPQSGISVGFGLAGGRAKGVMRGMKERVMYEAAPMAVAGDFMEAKDIEKKGLSEYFLYSIEGTETIPNGWSKRLISFDTEDIPVANLFKYELERYGDQVVRFLSFTNDEDHELGHTPIPGGLLKVYRSVDQQSHLSYVGQSDFKYIPVSEEVELNLGRVEDVKVEPVLMSQEKENFRFNNNRDVSGFDEVQTYDVTITNTRPVPVKVEITCNLDTPYWTLTAPKTGVVYKRLDASRIKFIAELPARSEAKFNYRVRLYRGERQEDWREN